MAYLRKYALGLSADSVAFIPDVLSFLQGPPWSAWDRPGLESRHALAGEPVAPVLDGVPADLKPARDEEIGLTGVGTEDDLGAEPVAPFWMMLADLAKLSPFGDAQPDLNQWEPGHRAINSTSNGQIFSRCLEFAGLSSIEFSMLPVSKVQVRRGDFAGFVE